MSSTQSPPVTIADRLVTLVESLDVVVGHHDHALVVRVRGLIEPSGELDALPLASHEVYDELLGAEFPPHCEAVAVAVRGRARSLGDFDHDPGDVLGSAVAVFAIARDGTSASSLRVDDAEPLVTSGDADHCVGRLADAVRRGFGLPTEVPDAPVSLLLWSLWLHRIHERAIDAESVTAAVVDSLRPELPSSWSELRAQCVDGAWPDLGIHPELAEWMDDGIFSRTCVQAFPEPIEVMIELSELVERRVWDHLVDRLAASVATEG